MLLRETAISIVISAVISALAFVLVFGHDQAVDLGAYGFDFFPQGFMIALMSSLVPSLQQWRRIGGAVGPVLLRGLYERRYQYGTLAPGKPLRRYGIEQQAAIVEDWFRITQGLAQQRGTGSAAAYRAVLPFSGG